MSLIFKFDQNAIDVVNTLVVGHPLQLVIREVWINRSWPLPLVRSHSRATNYVTFRFDPYLEHYLGLILLIKCPVNVAECNGIQCKDRFMISGSMTFPHPFYILP